MEEKDGEKTITVPKPRQKYDDADRKKIEKGTEQVKESKIDILTSRYENFKMKEGETIHVMFTKLSSITNELRSLGDPISMTKQVRKVLRILPKSWESKVDAITEAKDLKVLTMDALIGNLKTHEMNRNYDLSKKEVKKDKSLMFKYKSDEVSSDDDDMAYLISRFQKIVRKNKIYKRGTNGTRNAPQGDTCYKCGKSGHFIRECPLLKNENKEQQKHKGDKENRRDLVPGNRDRKAAADMVVKRSLAAWGNSSSDSEDPDEPKDVSTVAVHEEETVFNALMAHTENEEEDNQVTLLDMKNDLDKYSHKKLRALEKVMLDSVIELTSERDTMNAELEILTENKVQFEETMSRMVSLESNNSELKNQLYQITEEAEKLNGKSNSLQAEIQEKLKNSETNLSLSLEKSNKLEQDIVKLKEELEKSLKWTKSSMLLSNATNQSNFNKKGLGSLNISPSYNPHSKYVFVSDNLLCLHCGKNGHLKNECVSWETRVKDTLIMLKDKMYQKRDLVSERSSSQCWYMDSGCSKYITGDVKNFLSLKTLQGGGVSFNDGKKGYILAVGKIGRYLEDSIDNVYHVDRLKYSLLSVSQICDKGNEVKFTSEKCTMNSSTKWSSGKKEQNLGEHCQTMIIESNLVQSFWAEAVNTACHVTNRCLLRAVLNKTPYELLNNRKPMLSYLRAFGYRCFVLNNGKDDLGKFDPRSDEGVFVGYSSSNKAYRIFNKQTQCIEERIHVVFDENGSLKNDGSNDDDNVLEMLKSKKTEGAEADADQQLKNDCDDQNHSLPEEDAEVEQDDMVPGTTQNSSQSTSDSPKDDVTLDEEEHADLPNQSAAKSGWKHSSSHPLDNLISPLNSGIQTRSKIRNLVAFSAFI
ncbi:uncharacterized protein [Solanum lycopersicum]|uniref:uncharacterized protein n=1 Tax=Solanum lycopersicum TaxID=4081 RepID=UPI003747B7AE